MRRADSRAACTAGNSSATSTPIIAITTSNSTSVNPAHNRAAVARKGRLQSACMAYSHSNRNHSAGAMMTYAQLLSRSNPHPSRQLPQPPLNRAATERRGKHIGSNKTQGTACRGMNQVAATNPSAQPLNQVVLVGRLQLTKRCSILILPPQFPFECLPACCAHGQSAHSFCGLYWQSMPGRACPLGCALKCRSIRCALRQRMATYREVLPLRLA